MTSDVTRHWAMVTPGQGWIVSWLPGRVLDRNQATTAMVIAETVVQMVAEQATHEHRLWPFLDKWAGELGLTGPDVLVRASEPPAADRCDPGPVPPQVEPETVGNVTTIPASPRAVVKVTADVGRTGMTGLTLETHLGASVTVALPGAAVDALLEALATAAPVPYSPRLPEVDVYATQPVPPVGVV